MNEQDNNPSRYVEVKGVRLPWYWSIGWVARYHPAIPPAVLMAGIRELNLQPCGVADGALVFDGEAYARLQQWLIAKGDQVLAELQDQDANQPAADPTHHRT